MKTEKNTGKEMQHLENIDRLSRAICGLSKRFTAFRRREERRNEFFAHSIHRLRTPLTPIREYTKRLLADAAKSGRGEEQRILEIILRQCEKLFDIIQDIASFSSIDSGRFPLLKEPLLVVPLWKKIVESYEPLFRKKGIRLISRMKDCECQMRGDRLSLQHIFRKILSGCLDRCSKGDALDVRVSSKTRDGMLWLAASFRRLSSLKSECDSSPRQKELGVYVLKGIVRAHDGIWEEHADKSSFCIMLPLDAAGGVIPEHSECAEDTKNPLTV